MAKTINVQITDGLRRYIDFRVADSDIYSTPSEYLRDLVRRDMEQHEQKYGRGNPIIIPMSLKQELELHKQSLSKKKQKKKNTLTKKKSLNKTS